MKVPQSELEVLKGSEPVRRRLVNDFFKVQTLCFCLECLESGMYDGKIRLHSISVSHNLNSLDFGENGDSTIF